jgi:hypothetical protein
VISRAREVAGQPLVFRFQVDAGEDAVRAHAPQQPDPRDAASGPDLDDRTGADGGGQEAQGRTGGGADRGHSDLFAEPPGGTQGVVLGEEVRDVGHVGLHRVDGCLLAAREPADRRGQG